MGVFPTMSHSEASWHERCLICGSSTLGALRDYDRAHLVRCRACGMVFAARIPTEAELTVHYGDYGHAWYDSPITRRRYAEVLDSLEPYRMGNRLLDVGCGAGYFLEEARSRGWEVHGTEYSGFALELARTKHLNVVPAPIDVRTYEPGSFDVVTAFEVFEHVRDPMHEAALAARVLRPGGLLYCTTPNFNSLSRRTLGPRWSVIAYPEHLWYFTPTTISAWLHRSGFVTQTVVTSGVSVSRLRSATHESCRHGVPEQVASPPSYPGDDERLRRVIERSRLLRLSTAAVNRGLSALGAGDTIKGRFTRSRQSA
jgi:2-polyprenyl-3-methyl-5-hydroxy-6-metoxy-1,4-benzoquinol methylase